MYIKILSLIVFFMFAISTLSRGNTWNGSASDDWFDSANWTPVGVPGNGDTVLISSGTVLITNQTAALAAFTNSGGTVSFSNWWAKLDATEIHLSGGTLKPNNAFTNNVMSNRVWIVCSNLTVDSAAVINADGLGYDGVADADGSGPGGGTKGAYRGSGGGYGGEGGMGIELMTPGASYGTPQVAGLPGSAGGHGHADAGSPGGGAVRIDATGAVVVNGAISAKGGQATFGGGGSGGGIAITCNTLSGGGTISAQGGKGSSGNFAGTGGGGRIALHYNTIAQAGIPIPSLSINTAPGEAFKGESEVAGLGTIYVPDNRLLQTYLKNIYGWWYAPGFTNWSVDSLTLEDAWLGFPSDNFVLTVTNDITGIIGKLFKISLMTNATLNVGGDMLCNFDVNGSSSGLGTFNIDGNLITQSPSYHFEFNNHCFYQNMAVGGSLTVSNTLYLYSRATNGIDEAGLLLAVSNDVLVASSGVIIPVSNPTNGGSPLITMDNMTIENGGAINADSEGFMGRLSANNGQGYGPGGGSFFKNCGAGGGYGGRGSNGLRTDSSNAVGGVSNGWPYAPQWPGSAGGSRKSQQIGQNGGGLVRVEAAGTITLNGSITANGHVAYQFAGAGAGGGIFITANTFQGNATGLLQANGGNYSANGGGFGGGGRIAVLYGDIADDDRDLLLSGQEDSLGDRFQAATSYAPFQGTTEVNKGYYDYSGYFSEGDATYDAEDGTVYFVTVLPPRGTFILIR